MSSFLDASGLTYLWGKIKTLVSNKADKIQEVNHGTSDTTFTLTPNVMHIWGTVSSLNLSLPTDSNSTLDEYLFTFTCPTGGTTLTLPASIVWIQEPEFEEGKTYQVSIVNGLAGFLTNNMVAGGGSAPGTETDPIFKASPAYGIAASDITNWNSKQAALVSGTNIKTVNNESLLGSGNISIQGGGGDTNVIEAVKVNGTALTPDSNKAVDVPVPTESTVSGWGFTKNTGTYSKPSGGIPKTDLASAVQTSLGKADTALQSYTETDPVFTASAAHGITSANITSWNNKVSNVQADWNATSGLAVILNKPTNLVTTTSLNTALSDYLPLAGGTMSNTDKVTNLNADLLDGFEASDMSRLGWVTTQNVNTSVCSWFEVDTPSSNAAVYSYEIITKRSSSTHPNIEHYILDVYRYSSTQLSVSLINNGVNFLYGNFHKVCVAISTDGKVYVQHGSTGASSQRMYIRCKFNAGSISNTAIGSSAYGTADGFTAVGMVEVSGYLKVDGTSITYTGDTKFLTPAANVLNSVTVYSGSSAPSSSTGEDGDIYIQTS